MKNLYRVAVACLCFTALQMFAAMTVQSLSGPVTATEINSFKTFMQTQSPPSANTYDNTMADGTAGMNCEALGLMYEVTNDTAILDEMIQFADAFISLRNDFTDRRVMWTGNVEPVWLTKASTSPQAGYAGCENNDIVGHVAYCAKLILQTPSIWNTTVSVGDPHGYGATYYQRALTYIARMEEVQDNYMTPWFIDSSTKRIKDSTAVDPAFSALGQSTTAWNRQMMFLSGWQRLSECHAILGDNPAKVTLYDAIVSASTSWFQSEWQSASGGGQPCYLWQYSPGHAGGTEEMNGHAAYDMWGLSRAFVAGKYGMTQSLLRPFAETLRYIIYQAGTSYTFAEWVNGDTSSTRSYIYSQWMGISAYDPCVFATMANADMAQGSQGSNPIYDAEILWVKNARARGIFANNCDAGDFSLTTPWVENLTSGQGTNYSVTVNSLAGFAVSGVSLGMSGLPSGVTASFSAAPNSTLTISASGSVPSGIYGATITGTGGGMTRIAPITLVVTNTGAPSFTISAAPSVQSVTIGGNTSYTATVAALNGFSGTVALSVGGLPAHASGSFTPASITGGSGTSTLNISTATNTPNGSVTLTITGMSGALSNSTTASLSLSDFLVSASPGSQTVTAGNSTNYTVTVGTINGFNGTVTLSASGLPTGASASFNPATVTSFGTSILTITTSGSTPPGTSTVTVNGTSGNLVHGASVGLTVTGAGGGLPSGWTDADVGATTPAGSATYSGGVFTVKGGGADIWGTADQFNYVYQSVSGDCTTIGRVATVQNTATSAKAGVMIRETTAAGSAYAGCYITPSSGAKFEYRASTGGTAASGGSQTGITAPYWVKIVRSGNTLAASISANGTSWTALGSTTVTMAASVDVGLPVCSHSSGNLCTATIDNVSVSGGAPDFSISATPSARTVTAGGSTNYTVTISALNGFNGTVALTMSGLPTGASGAYVPTSITGSGSATFTVNTSASTPTGDSTLTLTGTSGSLVHSTSATLTVNPAGGDSNIAPSGIAYGWNAMTSSTGNSPKVAQAGLNDNNLTVNVDIDSAGDAVNAWEAAGITWSVAKTVSSVDFINGDITSGGDGFLTANCKLQFSTDGSTWADSGWTISPAYPNSSAAGGHTYTFSGTAVSGKLGARVIGQVRTTDSSYHWIVKEVQIIGH